MSSPVRPSPTPLFAPGVRSRLWSRLWPALAFYVLTIPAQMIRSIADDVGLPVRRQFNALEAALLTDAPTRWLQGSVLDVEIARAGAAALYLTWFFVPITTALGVLMFRPRDYWRFVAFLVVLYYATMPFFALYPLEPPWAQDPGLHRFVAERFPEAAATDPNPYAPMPSLHVALPAAAAFWYGLRTLWGRLALAYSALIGFVVVYGGEHYIADVAAGYALAFATNAASRRWCPLLFTERSSPASAEARGSEQLEPPAVPRAA